MNYKVFEVDLHVKLFHNNEVTKYKHRKSLNSKSKTHSEDDVNEFDDIHKFQIEIMRQFVHPSSKE